MTVAGRTDAAGGDAHTHGTRWKRVLRAMMGFGGAVLASAIGLPQAQAEPWLAVRGGLHCVQCHANPTGGGMRNAFGNSYAQNVLAARRLPAGDAQDQWTGSVNRWIAVGGDVRGRLAGTDIRTDDDDPPTEFELQDVFAYVQLNLIPERLAVHVDERIGPRGASNRQAYVLFRPGGDSWYLRAGRFFLPYGLRLQDDGAFIRQVTGINFSTPDTGFEAGYDGTRWSLQAAVSNGTAGGPEVDDGKQLSVLASYVQPRWRFGLSINHNHTGNGDRNMAGLFAGLITGPLVWLAEVDVVRDDTLPGERRQPRAGLLEMNWGFRPGHNLKITQERHDPDEDAQRRRTRTSLAWEHFPFQFVQSRIGLRRLRGTAGVGPQNRDEWFAQLHAYF